MNLDDRNASYTTTRSEIVDMVPGHARHILDVGCSNGALGRALKVLHPNCTVYGIEFDPRFAANASNFLDGIVNADLNIMDWQTVFPGRTFDCMIFADVLEHLVEPQQCLKLALQRLSPGGKVIVSLPNIRHLSALWSIFFTGHFPRRDRGIFDRTHLKWFTFADAQELLSDSGLKITSTSMALRWGDHGGGRINRLLNRLPKGLQHWGPVREFLAYQICFTAVVP